jgi:hypothetical protein
MAKKRKQTPARLDHLFSRHVIEESEYRSFWPQWWAAESEDERQELIDFYSGDEHGEEEEEEEPEHFAPTKIRKTAEQQAKKIGGYVARRTASGKFSKRGKLYQAIRRPNK